MLGSGDNDLTSRPPTPSAGFRSWVRDANETSVDLSFHVVLTPELHKYLTYSQNKIKCEKMKHKRNLKTEFKQRNKLSYISNS